MGYSHKKPHIQIGTEHIKAAMTFSEAAEQWLAVMQFPAQSGIQRMGFVHPRTIKDYKTVIRALSKRFAVTRLCDIAPADLRTYQELRASGALNTPEHKRGSHQRGPGAGAAIINKEIALLMRFLRGSKAWTAEMQEAYMPLMKDQADIPRAMTPPQQAHFLAVASSKEEWALIYWYSLFALRTTMGAGEMRGMRRRDIDLEQGVVIVRAASAKNPYRIRTIPLDRDAIRAANYLLDRAITLGSHNSEHYIFPFRVTPNFYDPTRSMGETGLSRQWREVRSAADLPWLRTYDLRHTAITRFAEAGTPIQVLMDMAGHVSQLMQEHYTHISEQSKRQAVAMMSLNAAEADKPQSKKKPLNAAAYAMVEKANTALGGFTLPALVKKLQRAGLAPDVIIGILADEGEA